MGWVSKNGDDDSGYYSSSSGDFAEIHGSSNPKLNGDGDRCATRKVVKSQCRTEEVEPGKYIRKCEKTEQIFKDCVGRPSEMVQSLTEYTSEDVTNQMGKGPYPLDSRERKPYFPGLRSDIEGIEHDFFGGIKQFFDAAEEMKKEFFSSVGRIPRIYDDESSTSHKKHGIHIENNTPSQEVLLPKNKSDGDIDLSGLAKDV